MTANVTIGMVTYNRIALTEQTLKRALTHTGKKYNLIIVDNCSTDGTVEWLRDRSGIMDLPELESFTIIPLRQNFGVAYGRNICLKKTHEIYPETKFICTLDNDVAIPNTHWLKDCCEVVGSNDQYGCCAINYESNKVFPPTLIKLHNGRQMKVRIIVNTPGTATTVFTKDLQEKLGYFKRYANGIYGHEDANYFLRAKCLGKILFYLDESGIHLGDGENDTGPYRQMKTEQFNKYRPEFVKDLHANYAGRDLYIDFKEEEE